MTDVATSTTQSGPEADAPETVTMPLAKAINAGLRRAMEVAPDQGARRAAERDFRYVRTRSRLWLRFDASVRPSSWISQWALTSAAGSHSRARAEGPSAMPV